MRGVVLSRLGVCALLASLLAPPAWGADDHASADTRRSGGAAQLDEMRSPVVRIMARQGGRDFTAGSGVVIGADGADPGAYRYVVTSAHLVSEILASGAKPYIAAKGSTDEKDDVPARVTRGSMDRDLDLVILEFNQLKIDPAKLATTAPQDGDVVHAVGFPSSADQAVAGREPNATVSPGQVSNVETRNLAAGSSALPIKLILHSAAIAPGDAGGALFDDCAALVGVNRQDDPAKAGIAVAASEVLRMARRAAIPVLVAAGACKAGPATEEAQAPTPPAPTVAAAPMTASPVVAPAVAAVRRNGALPIVFVAVLAGLALLVAAIAVVFLWSNGPLTRRVEPLEALPAPGPAAPGHLILAGFDGAGYPITFNVTAAEAAQGGGVVIGRAPSEGGRILADERPRPLVSREHARIGFRDGRFTIQDSGSANGTFISGQKLSPGDHANLSGGDVLRLADCDFTVTIQ